MLKLLQFLREKNFKQTIPQVKIDDGEEITYDNATATLRRAVHFYSALQASDGHWPAENAGPLFFLPPLVSFIIIIYYYHCETHILAYLFTKYTSIETLSYTELNHHENKQIIANHAY